MSDFAARSINLLKNFELSQWMLNERTIQLVDVVIFSAAFRFFFFINIDVQITFEITADWAMQKRWLK